MNAETVRDLKYFEQNVNDRYGTSAAPSDLRELLPEHSAQFRLRWARVSSGNVEIFTDGSPLAQAVQSSIRDGENVFIPIHPLEESRWSSDMLVESGTISVSASYRTVFFEPDANGLLSGCADVQNAVMLKLHLERPLRGIDGDRRLTRDKIEKCVELSTVLRDQVKLDPLGQQCEIIPEFLGLSHSKSGVLFREIPVSDVMPLFSLSSIDTGNPTAPTYIEHWLRGQYGENSQEAAGEFGFQLARPLLRSLFAGFRAGFSMEMHAQNVLIRPGGDSLIDRVYFRDLEGVVFSSRFRAERGLEPLFDNLDNDEIDDNRVSMTRWFNRNVDHDLGRVFSGALQALKSSGYFDERCQKIAVQTVRDTLRECVKDAELQSLNWPGRLLPVSRSPYGNGFSKGHYYSTRYR
jgi:hypothetical protein